MKLAPAFRSRRFIGLRLYHPAEKQKRPGLATGAPAELRAV